MSTILYPYRKINGDLRLDLRDVRIDDVDATPDPVNPDERVVSLHGLEKSDWSILTLSVELQGPTEEIKAFPDGDTIRGLVTVHCADSHARMSFELKKIGADGARWSGSIELRRCDFRGATQLLGILVGTAGGQPGRFLAESAPWVLDFDEPVVKRETNGSIDVKWVDFSAEDAPVFLEEYEAEPYYIDLVDRVPCLYLNKSKRFERLPAVLDDRKRTAAELALHNAERTGIARSVWMAMLNAAIAGIREDEGGVDPDWPDSEWQERVLKLLLPMVYRNQSPEEALRQAHEDWRSNHAAALLESRAQSEINRRIGAARLLRQTLHRMGPADDAEEAE